MKNPRCYHYSNDACRCPAAQVHDPHFTSLVKEDRFTSLLGEAWGTEDVAVLQSMALLKPPCVPVLKLKSWLGIMSLVCFAA